MNKIELLKSLRNTNRGNIFSIEIPTATEAEKQNIEGLLEELVKDGKIKLRESLRREYSIALQGVIKYASE